ncbi:Neutral/alkaline nonlysosomal ceramidase, partial [Aureobasidium melanogenum]
MGYADTDQSGTGLRQRIYCRAFIIGSLSDDSSRVAYLVLDTQSGDTAVRHGILEGLKRLGPEYEMYNKNSVAITGTHSHSGPGAWLNYLLPQITSKGFNKESYEAIVNGSVLAIKRAHASLVPGRLRLGQQTIMNANANRSPYAYLQNPASERKQYESDVDKTMTLLKFERASDGHPLGALSWFPVHGTSLYQNNTLVTGDNKGVAAYLLEEYMKEINPEFVGGFSQANVGDTSPNTLGAFSLGYGFAGGTTDGPGAFDFSQGTNDSDDSPSLKNPVWKLARKFIHEPSDEQRRCQSPKPVLLDVGEADRPYAWSPNIVDIQLLRIGSLIIIVSPGEATTMAGRRWRNALDNAARSVLNIETPTVVLGGPANTYAHYISTEEEYRVQRYEGASTLYGPHTLEAYVNLTLQYLPYLGSADERSRLRRLPSGPSPPININSSWSFITPVVVDHAGLLRKFGNTLSSPDPSKPFTPGTTVRAEFVGANPRNNFRLEGTFAAVEKYDSSGSWIQVRDDRDWFLVYKWKRTSSALGTSEVSIEWEIEPGTEPGMYRLKYYGDAKSLTGTITPFEGTSGVFNVAGDGKSDKSKSSFWDELVRV